jgi:hypothetical protein
VSNAREDLPDPLTPVTTVIRFSGISRFRFLRLFCRAPLIRIARFCIYFVAFLCYLKILLNAFTCMHEADDQFFSEEEVRKSSAKELGLPPPDPVDIRLKDGDVLEAGELNIRGEHFLRFGEQELAFFYPAF